MDHAIVWAVIGLVLVIVELLTGTFYLLMLGVAAFGAALAAWLGLEFPAQSIVAAVVEEPRAADGADRRRDAGELRKLARRRGAAREGALPRRELGRAGGGG
jgi:hypothetical protein